jgi:Flp pilus assembly protein TadB
MNSQRRRWRGISVSNSESENKQRDRQIADNEANRVAVSGLRVSSWAIGVAVIVGVIVFGIAWAWMHR